MAALDLLLSLLVRVSVVCLALGTLILLPLVFCVGYDLFLWTWRQWRTLFSGPQRPPVPGGSSRSSRSSPSSDAGDAREQTLKQSSREP